MSQRTLFLAWQDSENTRLWFPVARLHADVEEPRYRFRYIRGAERARTEAKFPLLLEFPDIDGDYCAHDLFPLFQNRVINPRRPGREDYLRSLDLGPDADPIEILSTSGGRRVTDAYEVFPKLVKDSTDGSFTCRFFLHGWRHVNPAAQARVEVLEARERLHVALELTNPCDPLAVQIQTRDYHMIGRAPRYLAPDLATAMAAAPFKCSVHVVRLNSQQGSSQCPLLGNQPVLIEMRGYWKGHEPMTGEDYRPMVADI